MSPAPPIAVPHVSAPGRSETKNSERPNGFGQKSAGPSRLIGASSLRGTLHGAAISARSAAQMSFVPKPLRVDANSKLRPSGVSIGQPSANVVLTATTGTACCQVAGGDQWSAAATPVPASQRANVAGKMLLKA